LEEKNSVAPLSIIGSGSTQVQSFTEEMQQASFGMGVGLFGIALGTSFLNEIATYMTQTEGATVDSLYSIVLNSSVGQTAKYYPNYLTNAQFADRLAANLLGAKGAVVADDSWQAGADWAKAALDGGMTRAEVAKMAVEAVAAIPTDDASYGAAVATFNNKVAVSEYYTLTAGGSSTNITNLGAILDTITAATDVTDTAALQAIVDSSAVSTTGETFTLTTGADSKTGTSGNDTFDASLSSSSMTFGPADTIDGGAGTDTLTIISNAAGSYSAGSMKNIEVINLTASGGATTLALAGVTGVQKVNNSGSTVDVTVSGLVSLATEVAIANTSATSSTTVEFATATVAGSADTATISVSGLGHATTNGTDFISVAGVETLNIKATGGASTIDTLTTAAATKYVVSGDQNLTVGATLGGTVLTVDASALTGALTITTDAATAMTVTGGSGNDSFTFTGTNAVNDSINAGAGNDTVTFAANLATTDTVNGGDGTDTLQLTTALATGYTKPATATITNFEVLKLSNALAGDLTVANIQAGITTLDLNAGSGAQTVTMEAGAQNVKIGASNTGALVIQDTGTATTDSVTVTNTGTADDMFDTNNLTITGFETLNLVGTGKGAATTQDLGTLTVTADSGGTATVNFSGSNTFTTTGAITAAVIDASGLTGTAVLTMGAAAVGATKITGGSNGDTLVGIAATATSIDGGAGNDTITGGSGNDTLVGGDGNDSITAGAGNDSINAGAGNDTIVMAGNLATGDVIDGGDGTDTISMTTAGLSTIAGYSISAVTNLNNAISNVERLLVSDQFNVGAAFDMARLDSISYITLANGITGAEEISGLTNGATIVVNADNDNDADILTLSLGDSTGTTDTLNYTMTQAATDDYGVLAVSGVETLNITANEATADATVRVATLGLNITTATAGTTVNFLGTESITVDTAIAAQTIDATQMGAGTAFIMTNTTGSGLSQTIRTGSGADTIYGGGGADTIDAGAGADSIMGGTGADSITAGDGADTIVGGSGNDTIILTESTASSDHVRLDFSEAGAHIDTIIGFTTGATSSGGDVISLDISELAAAATAGGVRTAALNEFVELFDGAAVTAGAATLQLITGAATVTDSTDIIGLQGSVFSSTSEVEDALEVGGSFALVVHADGTDAGDGFFIVYSNGTDAKVAVVYAAAETAADTDFEVGDLKVVDLATITGVSAITATTFDSTNFVFV